VGSNPTPSAFGLDLSWARGAIGVGSVRKPAGEGGSRRHVADADLIVEARDRVDRELAVDSFQVFQIHAVLTASGEALEGDDAA